MKKIEVKGHSGCDVCIEKSTETFHNNELIITKSTNDKKYIPRLKAQIDKQKSMRDKILYKYDNYINIPSIISEANSELSYKASMEYMYGNNFISFFENSTKKEINDFITKICDYVDFEISNCESIYMGGIIMYEKWQSVKANIEFLFFNNYTDEDIKENIQNIIDFCDKVFKEDNRFDNMPIGMCHGDLTFSNIIFTNDGSYGLIDFLDSFIETPLMDIVKLRQDSSYNWSTLMYDNNNYDKVRYDIIRKYIDKRIHEHFYGYSFYTDYYDMFQLMNFLRVLQYAKDDEVTKYLIKTINSIIDNYNFKEDE